MALTFFWRCENSVTLDGTNDFTAGDGIATAVSAIAFSNTQSFPSGAYSVLTASGGDYYEFDCGNPTEDIYIEGAGSASFAFYITDWNTGAGLFAFQDASSGNNHLHVQTLGTGVADGGLTLNIRQAGNGNTTLSTGDIGLSVNTWYNCIIRWSEITSDAALEVYDSASSLIDSQVATPDSTHWSDGIDLMRIGEYTGTGSFLTHVDHIMVADAYDEPLEDNLDVVNYPDYGAVGGAVDLIIQDALHSHTADNLALTQQNVLAIADALHSHTADNLTLSLSTLLVVQDSAHAHMADNLALTQTNILAIQDALHAHMADSIALTQQSVLVISDSLHAIISDNVTLTLPSGGETPIERVYIIRREDRFHVEPAENRIYVVLAENRAKIIH